MRKPVDLNDLLQQIGRLLHLTWIDEQTKAAPLTEGATPGPLVLPPPQEMEVLHRLAMLGNMQDILQRTVYLAELDERYRPFANQLRLLVKGYQSKAILNLVTSCLEKS